MIRRLGTLSVFFSALLFPWPLTACLALGLSVFEPWVPLAAGLFVDTLFYTPHGTFVPLFTLVGVCVTAVSFFVRSRLKTGSIEE